MSSYRRSVSSASGKKGKLAVKQDVPDLLTVYDILLPRKRSSTFPTIDYNLWKTRNSLEIAGGSDVGGAVRAPALSSDASGSSRANSQDGLSEYDVMEFPAVLSAYDIPMPCGGGHSHLRLWDDVRGDVTGGLRYMAGRKRSITMPESDLRRLMARRIVTGDVDDDDDIDDVSFDWYNTHTVCLM